MAIDKVREYFRQFGMEDRVMEFDVSSATVDLAAEAVGVEGARICKTMSFLKPNGEGAILVQMAGDGRINNRKFKDQFGFKAKMLKPDEVLEYTGHAIGGVCAFAIERDDVDVYYVPATKIAKDEGFSTLANMILMGKLMKACEEIGFDGVETAVSKVVPPRKANLIDVNIKAIKAGYDYE